MNQFELCCEEIDEDHDGFVVVRFSLCPIEGSIYYVTGTMSIQAPVNHTFVIGTRYSPRFNTIK